MLIAWLALAACEGELPEPSPGGSANYSRSLGSEPDFSSPSGRIEMTVWLPYEAVYLYGSFADGPPLKFQVESERIGQCRLLSYSPSVCTPSCEGTDQCIDEQCESWPERQDRGEMVWVWPDGDQQVAPDALLSYAAEGEAFQTGEASISFEEVELESPMIEAAEPVEDWSSALVQRGDGDGVLRWSNPVEHARVRLYMTDCAGSHGGVGVAELECEGPDTGELTVAGSFLDALDAGDWTHGECGSHTFERYHAAAPVVAEEIDASIRFETVGDAGLFYWPEG